MSQGPSQRQAHEEVYVAVRDCFDAVRRLFEDRPRRRRGDVKRHDEQSHRRIAQLLPKERYGTITATYGEIYFHPNAVVGSSFDRLNVGDEVRFVVHPGEGKKGPQASTVILIGKHHLSPGLS